ncbi:sulfite exporter TauE/SafE family protein [Rehaibacterium terrae]|jgi:sulfite exporter TauE/SafE|uniref:Urease accessory protein UreH-like transmembrane domain-containing protein n=1 Tax=Rehaibacterium terrae TaxID=1341696 RepID=A0A7W7XZF6_9GAMM|nr:sulfite exporter TauE/SafE family protein [Rehaibacterium terrae]MBB5015148.1 hypothetical protein [Rehaibacterium terrae]
MPIDWLTVTAAFLTGLLGGVHCVAMCGGVAAGVALGSGGQAPLRTAVESNLGRILGYALAGALVAGIGAGALRLAQAESLMLTMRMGVGVVLVLVALRLLDRRGRLAFLARPGAALWTRLAPLQRRLLPANTTPRRVTLGLLWGWLPCGLSTTLLFAAWLSADALQGGLVMAAFGLGTLPTMIPLTWSGARAARWLARPAARTAAATLVLSAGLLTLAAPWLAQVPALHAWLEALGCRTLPG